MAEKKHISFDEKVYTIMKEEYQEYRKNWENRFESFKTKPDSEKKENEKKLKKIEQELFKYAKYDSFLAWYLVYEYKLNEKLLYDIKEKNWYCYENEKKYLWELINEEIALSIIDEYSYKAVPWDFNTKINNYTRRNELILRNLKSLLEFDFQKKANFDLVIFKNDVVVNIKKAGHPIVTTEIGPKDYIVQSCPVEWIPNAQCPSIDKFFNYITDNNENNNKEDIIKLIKCIMHVTTRSNRAFNLQFFLEINGIGGSGKTLLQKIFECLVPSTKKITSTIDALEKSQFESAYFKNKNLCVFSDHTGFVGEATMIKKLSGGELIPAEFKHKDKIYFIYYGVIIITTNFTLRYSASESSIRRRRIELTLDKEAPFEETKEEVLYFDEKGFPAGPWSNELPGLIQEIYKLSFEDVRSTIKTYLENQKHNTYIMIVFEMTYK